MKSASDMHDAYARFVRSQKPSLLTFSVCTVIVLPLLREGHKRNVLDLFVQRHHHRGCGRRRHPGGLVAVSLALLRRWCHRLSPSSVLPGVDEWRECRSSIGNRVSLFRFQKKKKKKSLSSLATKVSSASSTKSSTKSSPPPPPPLEATLTRA